jgi:hypothetical protein
MDGWHVQNETLLDPIPGYPNGYITKNGEWVALSIGGSKKFIILHNGKQWHTAKNYPSAVSYIKKQLKSKSKG